MTTKQLLILTNNPVEEFFKPFTFPADTEFKVRVALGGEKAPRNGAYFEGPARLGATARQISSAVSA